MFLYWDGRKEGRKKGRKDGGLKPEAQWQYGRYVDWQQPGLVRGKVWLALRAIIWRKIKVFQIFQHKGVLSQGRQLVERLGYCPDAPDHKLDPMVEDDRELISSTF